MRGSSLRGPRGNAIGALAAAALLFALTACGGGGSSTPKTSAAQATTAPKLTAIAKGTLSLKFPPGYHRAKASARKTAANTRTPAFVDPTTGSVLDIYVNGNFVGGLDGTPGHSVTIAPTADGTQTISNIPLYSTTTDVTVIEWDSSDTYILAVGELPSVAVSAGVGASLALTMQMNATGFAITTNADGSSSTLSMESVPSSGRAKAKIPSRCQALHT